jgi:GTP diphosphokinase / guanosine-3',5'-bis(diphosphate) 3'-diphosphatase
MVNESINYMIAYSIADSVHKDQKRRNGEPYIQHPLKTAEIVKKLGYPSEHNVIVAILHDTLEDATDPKQVAARIKEEFGTDVLTSIQALSHHKSIPYLDYIQNIIQHYPELIPIKIADIIQNITDEPSEKQIMKYCRALPLLFSALNTRSN